MRNRERNRLILARKPKRDMLKAAKEIINSGFIFLFFFFCFSFPINLDFTETSTMASRLSRKRCAVAQRNNKRTTMRKMAVVTEKCVCTHS